MIVKTINTIIVHFNITFIEKNDWLARGKECFDELDQIQQTETSCHWQLTKKDG